MQTNRVPETNIEIRDMNPDFTNSERKVSSRRRKRVTRPASVAQGTSAEDDFKDVKLPFPWKLHQLLEDSRTEGNEHIICWLPDGKSFKIHKQDEFCERIAGRYFRQSRFKSFTRQLYLYGFSKLEGGLSHGAFSHPHFVKENKNLSLSITRKKQCEDRRLKEFQREKVKRTMAEYKQEHGSIFASSNDVLYRDDDASDDSSVDTKLRADTALSFGVSISSNPLRNEHQHVDSRSMISQLHPIGRVIHPYYRVSSSASDWFSVLEDKFLKHSQKLETMIPGITAILNKDLEPRPIEEMKTSYHWSTPFR